MNEQAEQPTRSELDPEVEIRSDLWPKMSVSQLARQQEIVIDRLNKLYSMMGSIGTPSMRMMYNSLQVAMQDLSKLIDARTQQKK